MAVQTDQQRRVCRGLCANTKHFPKNVFCFPKNPVWIKPSTSEIVTPLRYDYIWTQVDPVLFKLTGLCNVTGYLSLSGSVGCWGWAFTFAQKDGIGRHPCWQSGHHQWATRWTYSAGSYPAVSIITLLRLYLTSQFCTDKNNIRFFLIRPENCFAI